MAVTRRKGYGINPAWTRGLRGPTGRPVCKWCLLEVAPPARYWCSRSCVRDYRGQADQAGLRAAVWRRDRGICALCPSDCGPHTKWEADHITPLVEGGAFGPANARTLCIPHHREATRDLAARRALARRA